MRRLITSVLASAALSACSLSSDFASSNFTANAPDITGPRPFVTRTPAERALTCVSQHRPRGQDLRIAVGEITDGTGARTFEDGVTPLLTQRPDMMFAVAMMKTGVRTLNRNATKVAEWEMAQSMEQRLGEGRPTVVEGQEFPFRPVEAGSMLGSTHFVSGALTEVNWNIYSDDTQTNVAGVFTGSRNYYISVAIDLMVTDTKTTEIVLAQSYTKQIVGKEVSRGLFRFFEVDEKGIFGPVELFDVSTGEQRNEPVQRAVRWLVETATYDIAATLTKTHDACDAMLAPEPAAPAPTEAAAPAGQTVASSSGLRRLRPLARPEISPNSGS